MKEVDKKDMPEISGGDVVSNGIGIGIAYPIFQVPTPEQRPDPSLSPDQPYVDPVV